MIIKLRKKKVDKLTTLCLVLRQSNLLIFIKIHNKGMKLNFSTNNEIYHKLSNIERQKIILLPAANIFLHYISIIIAANTSEFSGIVLKFYAGDKKKKKPFFFNFTTNFIFLNLQIRVNFIANLYQFLQINHTLAPL